MQAATTKAAFMPCRAAFAGVDALACAAWLLITETSSAVPIEPPTWRTVLFMAVPCGIKWRGRALIPAVVTGIIIMAVPKSRAV